MDKIGPDGTISFVLSDHYYSGFIVADLSGTLFWTSGPGALEACQYGAAGLTDRTLYGTQVLFTGQLAPVLYTWSGQVAAAGADASGRGQAAAVNQDGTINNSAHPAKAGAYIALYGTGGGQTLPAGTDGSITSGRISAAVTAANGDDWRAGSAGSIWGGAPRLLEGVMQVNVQIPTTVTPDSAIPVSIQMGDASSQTGVTIAVTGQ